jgi:hypothetical protein
MEAVLVCPISLATLTDPVVAADGHTYERACIEEWLLTHNTSPLTGATLINKTIVPNYTIRALLKAPAPIAQAHPTAAAAHLIVLLDRSGSMGIVPVLQKQDGECGFTPADLVTVSMEALLTCMTSFCPNVVVTIIAFNNTASTVYLRQNPADISMRNPAFNPQDGTYIPEAFDLAKTLITPGECTHIVLLTDGGDSRSIPSSILIQKLSVSVQHPVTVHTIGFGQQIAPDLLPPVAAATPNGLHIYIDGLPMVGATFAPFIANLVLQLLHPQGAPAVELNETDAIAHSMLTNMFRDLQLTRDAPTRSALLATFCSGLENSPNKTPYILAILKDMCSHDPEFGQVAKAILPANYQTWGIHYIPFITLAHTRMIDASTKEAALGFYTTSTFTRLLERVCDIYYSMPAPKPRDAPPAQQQIATMAAYFTQSGG